MPTDIVPDKLDSQSMSGPTLHSSLGGGGLSKANIYYHEEDGWMDVKMEYVSLGVLGPVRSPWAMCSGWSINL